MARNIEIKARIDSIEEMAARAAVLADEGPIEMEQDDTFFACPHGRLKLRTTSASSGELIFYDRPDQHGPKESFYVLTRTLEPDSLRQVLTLACGQIGRVCKHRMLYWCGRTRIHLDRVEGLGNFLELEVILEDAEPVEIGIEIANRMMVKLGIASDQLVEGAYLDLVQQK